MTVLAEQGLDSKVRKGPEKWPVFLAPLKINLKKPVTKYVYAKTFPVRLKLLTVCRQNAQTNRLNWRPRI